MQPSNNNGAHRYFGYSDQLPAAVTKAADITPPPYRLGKYKVQQAKHAANENVTK